MDEPTTTTDLSKESLAKHNAVLFDDLEPGQLYSFKPVEPWKVCVEREVYRTVEEARGTWCLLVTYSHDPLNALFAERKKVNTALFVGFVERDCMLYAKFLHGEDLLFTFDVSDHVYFVQES